jgi:hypothetical protein
LLLNIFKDHKEFYFYKILFFVNISSLDKGSEKKNPKSWSSIFLFEFFHFENKVVEIKLYLSINFFLIHFNVFRDNFYKIFQYLKKVEFTRNFWQVLLIVDWYFLKFLIVIVIISIEIVCTLLITRKIVFLIGDFYFYERSISMT